MIATDHSRLEDVRAFVRDMAKMPYITGAQYRKIARDPMLQAIDKERARRSLAYYMLNHAYTLDEHDAKRPIKRLPFKTKLHIQLFAESMLREPLLVLKKSRQMQATWTALHYVLWLGQRSYGRKIAIQSKKERDANHLIDRLRIAWDNQPPWAREPAQFKFCEAYFPKLETRFMGIPQGPDQLAQYTFSVILSDEFALQERQEEGFGASKPTVVGGGQHIVMSTVRGGSYHQKLADDEVEGA